jgi:carbamoyltransferase
MSVATHPLQQNRSPYVLGLSAPRHDAAAALLDERGVQAAIEESKLARSRSSSGVPYMATNFCLKRSGTPPRKVGMVVMASRRPGNAPDQCSVTPSALFDNSPTSRKSVSGPAGEFSDQGHELYEIARQPVITFDHHLCHAASAFYASPFDRALILALDERGDGISGTVAIGEGCHLRVLRSTAFPHSLGLVFSLVTQFLGFTPRRDEHKTQWLSLYGEPVFRDAFLKMLGSVSNGDFRLDLSYFQGSPLHRLELSQKFSRTLNIKENDRNTADSAVAPHIASSLQDALSTVLTGCLETWRQNTGTKYLCLAGGLFLNPLLVAAVNANAGFDEVFVQPAAGNAGCALGAAWLAWHQVLGNPRQEAISSIYWGPSYTSEQVKQVLDNCKGSYRWLRTEQERNEETIRLLEKGKIVAWYQGAAEFGPRALGNRSLLASPWAPYVRENLNNYVKHRNWFQPFAIAVTEEHFPQYFDCSPTGTFMTSVARAKPAARSLVSDFILPGNLVRLHIVQRRANPVFWNLLKKFSERAPAPFLVNTSFNLFGEPLVISPRDAIRSYFCSGIDALVIDGFVLVKT